MDDGFKAMSQYADKSSDEREPIDEEQGVEASLKTYGVDTEQMSEAAAERVGDLQELIIDEIRARPMRAIAWAAAAGAVLGFWAAR